jgi:hypothetical protein
MMSVPVAQARPDAPQVYGTSETFTSFWQELSPAGTDPEMRFPVYEYLTVRARNFGVPGLSVDLSGFGQLEATPAHVDSRRHGDLLYGYARWVDPNGRVRLTLGRQYLYQGGGYGRSIDGVAAEGFLPYHFEVQAFGGSATDRQFSGEFTRPVAGARVAWNPWDLGTLGVAYFQQWDGGDVDRQTVGADFAVRAWQPLTVSGNALFDMYGERLQDLNLRVVGVVTRWLQLFASYAVFDPDALLPRTSIFWVFAQETHQEAGGGLQVKPWRWLRLSGEFERYFLGGDAGFLAAGRCEADLPLASPLTVGARYEHLKEPANGYDAVRGYLRGETGFGMLYSAEGMLYLFSHDVGGASSSTTVFGGLGYRLLQGLVLDGGVEWNRNPLVTSEVVGFAKLTWNFAR